MLKFWNSLHRKQELFKPLHDQRVGLYTCGPTVYHPATIGNLRSYLFEDVLKRVLIFFGYTVTHVMNITDVGHLVSDADEGEDKIEREAKKSGKDAWALARENEALFLADLKKLNIIPANILPRATEHIQEQIDLIKILEEKGYTYRTSDGIYFDTSKFPSYGRLSGQKLEEKKAGARVAQNDEKKQASDFALWKFSPKKAKRQMEWESPWGVGFPGWHIECSAMSVNYLGQPFDIHCGGIDHLTVHHENEIAQSEAAFEKPLANYWMHNDFLLVDGKRMGKSEGNAYTLDEVIAKGFDPLAYRLFCLGAQYRSKLNFTWDGLEAAQHTLEKLREEARRLSDGVEPSETFLSAFKSALEDDLNSPVALAVVWDLLKSDESASVKGATLSYMDTVLGLGLGELVGKRVQAPANIVLLAKERASAREAKDWKRADALRVEIERAGWNIEDKNRGEFDLVPKRKI
ncbi:MAG TPA: cysteine--tRNA ligase [Patescibacteria group bacterium]|nr:cysteine--tRNA ligase [Patescibacteria group bacterium]